MNKGLDLITGKLLTLALLASLALSACKSSDESGTVSADDYLYESSTTININTQMTKSLGVEYDWQSVAKINTSPDFLQRLAETTNLSLEDLENVTSVQIDREKNQLNLEAKAQSSDDALRLIETYSNLFVEFLNRNERSYLEASLKNLDDQLQRQKEIVDQNRAKLQRIYEEAQKLKPGEITLEKDRLTYQKAKDAQREFLEKQPAEKPSTE